MRKDDFPILKKNKKLIYLDSAATTQKPRAVIDAEVEWYEKYNANVHRGAYGLSEKATSLFEDARNCIAKFINAEDVIFTKGTTESLNLVAHSWGRKNLREDDTVLLTEMEHHSNIVPWQMLGCKIKYWPIDENGELVMDNQNALFKGVKLLSITHISNVLGTINPLEEIITTAHKKGVKVCVDAAQSAPHIKIDVKKLDPDFLAFSSHKMLGPTGVGILYVKKERYEEMTPYQTGGGMIDQVTLNKTTFAKAPQKYEAGTMPLAQIYGFMRTIEYLEKVGMKNIQEHTQELTEYAYSQLAGIDEVTIYGPKLRGPVIGFNVKGVHPHDLATWLNGYGIAIRAGHHCAQPLHKILDAAATARISFHIYNDTSDIDKLVSALIKIIKKWKNFVKE